MQYASDIQLFNRLFADYRTRFIRFAQTYVKDISIAEDFTTEAFMSYWENKDKLRLDSNPPAYIMTSIKNKCLNYLEHIQLKQKVLTQMSAHSAWELNTRIVTLKACDPNRLFSEEIQQIITETLATLPPKTAEIFRLSRYENKSNKEIADMMDMTVKGVQFHISKALKELRISLKDYLPAIIIYLFFS